MGVIVIDMLVVALVIEVVPVDCVGGLPVELFLRMMSVPGSSHDSSSSMVYCHNDQTTAKNARKERSIIGFIGRQKACWMLKV